ncbi:hypothetical protein NC652_025115 [Populus alba x Populus x berolinensis]|nr:hypothetical protein NC652_025115 [Populus alba x Populus x berolinensis]
MPVLLKRLHATPLCTWIGETWRHPIMDDGDILCLLALKAAPLTFSSPLAELIMSELCTSEHALVTGTMKLLEQRFYFGAGEITPQIFTIKAPSWQLALKKGKQTCCDQASSKSTSRVSGTEPSCMQYCHDIACMFKHSKLLPASIARSLCGVQVRVPAQLARSCIPLRASYD